jgi:hypothetical protein
MCFYYWGLKAKNRIFKVDQKSKKNVQILKHGMSQNGLKKGAGKDGEGLKEFD